MPVLTGQIEAVIHLSTCPNPRGRLLLSKTYPGAAGETITYTYDSVASSNKGNGRLTSVSEQSGSTAFTYDVFGRVTKDAKNIQGLTYNVVYGYDTNDQITQMTLPSGRVVTFTRDNDGLITAVTTKPSATGTVSNVATALTYQPFGPLKSLTYGNGLTLTRTYNTNYWLTRTQVKNGTTALFDLGYQYYDDGRLGEIDDNAATGRTVYMSLTDSGRLGYASGPWGQETYSWDAAGNRIGDYLTVGGTTTTDNEITAGTSNRLVQTQDASATPKRNLAYRTGGDLYTDTAVGGSAYTYAYNARKRLVQISAGSIVAATYGYDFREQRVWRSLAAGPTIHYIFDGTGHLIAEHNGNTGAVLREYIWIDDMPVAVIDSSSGTATTYYIHTGHLEEPQVMTNASKAKVWDAYVTPFGKAKVFTTATANIDVRLPGQWFQTEAAGSGLNQNGFRDYDPSLGRYIEADPIGLNGGQNPYAYVDGRPYDENDAFGLDAVKIYDSNQAGGFGHAAAAYIDKQGNVTAYQFTGTGQLQTMRFAPVKVDQSGHVTTAGLNSLMQQAASQWKSDGTDANPDVRISQFKEANNKAGFMAAAKREQARITANGGPKVGWALGPNNGRYRLLNHNCVLVADTLVSAAGAKNGLNWSFIPNNAFDGEGMMGMPSFGVGLPTQRVLSPHPLAPTEQTINHGPYN